MISRREARGMISARIRSSINTVAQGTTFARGTASLHWEDLEQPWLNEPLEGLSQSWRICEENLRHSDPFADRVAFQDGEDIDAMADEELRRISSRRAAYEEHGWGLGGSRKWNKRNGGQKPRHSTRETLRAIRRQSSEQLLAGERLRRDHEDRKLRRRVREQAENAEVIQVPDHIWDRWLSREAA